MACESLITSPKWLSKSYFQTILQKNSPTHRPIHIIDLDIQPAIAAGNNFAGLLLRATLTASESETDEQQHSFVVKTAVLDVETAKSLAPIHRREMEFYARIMPRIQALLQSIGEVSLIAPRAWHIDNDNEAIIMQDLARDKYIGIDRMKRLDWDHLKVVVRKHALLHATSMVLIEQGEEFSSFQKGYYNEEIHDQYSYLLAGFTELGAEIAKWPGFEKYGEKWAKLMPVAVRQAVDGYKRRPEHMSVLNHGDSWTNNFMFKYDAEGKPEDLCFVS